MPIFSAYEKDIKDITDSLDNAQRVGGKTEGDLVMSGSDFDVAMRDVLDDFSDYVMEARQDMDRVGADERSLTFAGSAKSKLAGWVHDARDGASKERGLEIIDKIETVVRDGREVEEVEEEAETTTSTDAPSSSEPMDEVAVGEGRVMASEGPSGGEIRDILQSLRAVKDADEGKADLLQDALASLMDAITEPEAAGELREDIGEMTEAMETAQEESAAPAGGETPESNETGPTGGSTAASSSGAAPVAPIGMADLEGLLVALGELNALAAEKGDDASVDALTEVAIEITRALRGSSEEGADIGTEELGRILGDLDSALAGPVGELLGGSGEAEADAADSLADGLAQITEAMAAPEDEEAEA